MNHPDSVAAPRTPLDFALDIPFVQTLGLQLWRCEDGLAEVSLDLRPELRNSWQVAHGGVVMTLLDVAMAQAARSRFDAPDTVQASAIATIEMKTSFMRPAAGRITAMARVQHHTSGRLAFCEASACDAAGALCAHATGTFKILRASQRGA